MFKASLLLLCLVSFTQLHHIAENGSLMYFSRLLSSCSFQHQKLNHFSLEDLTGSWDSEPMDPLPDSLSEILQFMEEDEN